jgi:tRNA-guanine transglycosylase
MFRFSIVQKDKKTKARAGVLKTPHGEILTPNFNPVGTQGTVKTLSSLDLLEIGAQIVLSNTYHLNLRPGAGVIEKMGGLAKFMGWVGPASVGTSARQWGPTMTDSGGFQVFSLGVAQKKVVLQDRQGRKLSKFSKSVFLTSADTQFLLPSITRTSAEKLLNKLKQATVHEDGVWFYSHINGDKQWFDADVSIKLQEQLGADLIVAFDDHESPLWDHEMTKLSVERTNRWALQSIAAHKRGDQLLYGVVHGGHFKDLRVASAKFTDRYFHAVSIGGSYTSKEVLYSVLDWCVPNFSDEKPRHLLGIGEVQDLFEGVARGIDFFDCVAPTRRGRHGTFYISPQNGGRKENNFTMNVQNAKYKLDQDPIDPGCECMTCQHYTRSYVHHLVNADELLAQRLGSYHNVYFIVNLVKRIREAILGGSFSAMKAQWLSD